VAVRPHVPPEKPPSPGGIGGDVERITLVGRLLVQALEHRRRHAKTPCQWPVGGCGARRDPFFAWVPRPDGLGRISSVGRVSGGLLSILFTGSFWVICDRALSLTLRACCLIVWFCCTSWAGSSNRRPRVWTKRMRASGQSRRSRLGRFSSAHQLWKGFSVENGATPVNRCTGGITRRQQATKAPPQGN